MLNIIDKYLATWNASRSGPQCLLINHWSPEVISVDPQAEVRSYETLNELIAVLSFSQKHRCVPQTRTPRKVQVAEIRCTTTFRRTS